MEDEEYRNWAELPPELLSMILRRLDAIEVLKNAQRVCKSWYRVCKDPSMWQKIDMHSHIYWVYGYYYLDIICRHAVDRSQGCLVEFGLWEVDTDLLKYIADSSSNLKSLTISNSSRITNQGFVEAVVKLPQLEVLDMSRCSLSGESLKAVGQSCPNLKTLKLNRLPQGKSDDDALAIADTMPGLHHLQLLGNGLSNTGLNSILDNCPNLEHLDIRMCLNVNLVGDLHKRCYERVKVLRQPGDSTLDCSIATRYYNLGSSDDEYDYGLSDMDSTQDEGYDSFGELPLYGEDILD